MEKFTIDEIREIVEDWKTFEKNQDNHLDINECIKQIKNKELREIFSQALIQGDEEKTLKDFKDKIASRIDVSNLLTEETKDELNGWIDICGEFNVNLDIEIKSKEDVLNIIDLVKDNRNSLSGVWGNFDEGIQEKYFLDVIDKVKDNPRNLVIIWQKMFLFHSDILMVLIIRIN